MGLLGEVRSLQEQKKRKGVCSVAVLLDTLGADDREDLMTAMGDTTIDSATLTTVLVARGYDMHRKRMQEHRGGRCACGR